MLSAVPGSGVGQVQVSLPRGRPFCRHVLLLGGGEHGRGLADLEVAERGRGLLGLLRGAPHHPPPDVLVPGGELQLLQQPTSILVRCERVSVPGLKPTDCIKL